MTVHPKLRFLKNPAVSQGPGPDFLSLEATLPVRHLHQALKEYQPTPLVALRALAEKTGVRGIYIKDESKRFGLNAFKGLGGIYALACVVCEQLGLDVNTIRFDDLKRPELKQKISRMVFVTATDGNHGKGVAWAAGQLGCQAHVYMPKGSAENRAQAIRDAGRAEVTITDLCYDDAVRYARRMSEEKGWYLVQDTAWEGYEKVPAWIVQGYTTMVWEALAQLRDDGGKAPTHVFLQAGVGAMAGGVAGFLMNCCDERPLVATVEPEEVACIYESARRGDGTPHPATGSGTTIMAGLNCGEPCTITWPILRDFASWYLTCPDGVAAEGMRRLAAPLKDDPGVVAGESGAASFGALLMLLEREELAPVRSEMGLDENSVILLFNTEGDTDPDGYARIVQKGEYPLDTP